MLPRPARFGMRRILDELGFGQELTAALDCSSYHPGAPLVCRIVNRPQQLTNPSKNEGQRRSIDKSFWIGFQFHGHLANNKRTGKVIPLPKTYEVLERKCVSSCGAVEDFPETLPQFVTFDGDHGSCIMYSKPVVTNLKYLSGPSEKIDVEYTIQVPKFVVPTFPGKLIRYWYCLSITVCTRPTTHPEEVQTYHVPVEIEWSRNLVTLASSLLRRDAVSQFEKGQGRRKGSGEGGSTNEGGGAENGFGTDHHIEIDLGLLVKKQHPAYQVQDPAVQPRDFANQGRMAPPATRRPLLLFNYRTELKNAGTFSISNKGVPVATVVSNANKRLFPLRFLHFDFTFDREKYICHHLCAGLQWTETEVIRADMGTSSERAPISSTETAEAFHDTTRDKLNISLNFQVPAFAMTFKTDVISVQWQVIFELSLKRVVDASSDHSETSEKYEKLEWVLPLKVCPSTEEEVEEE